LFIGIRHSSVFLFFTKVLLSISIACLLEIARAAANGCHKKKTGNVLVFLNFKNKNA